MNEDGSAYVPVSMGAPLPGEVLQEMQAFLSREHLNQKIPAEPERVFLGEMEENSLRLLRVKRLRYRRQEDIHHSLVSLYAMAYQLSVPFFHVVIGSPQGVELLFGIYAPTVGERRHVENIFENFDSALKGFLPGCETERVYQAKKILLNAIANFKARLLVTGIPSVRQSAEKRSQAQAGTAKGLEQLTDSLTGSYAVITYAVPSPRKDIEDTQALVSEWHNIAHLYGKLTTQFSASEQESESISHSEGKGEQITFASNASRSTSISRQPGIKERWGAGCKVFFEGGERPSSQETTQVGTSVSIGLNKTVQDTKTEQFGTSVTTSSSREYTNKHAHYIEEQLTRLHRRLDAGRGMGMWRCVTQVCANSEPLADRVAQVLAGILSGPDSSLDPIRIIKVASDCSPVTAMDVITCHDHPLGDAFGGLSTLLTTEELSVTADMPVHDLPNIPVEKLSEYGRSQSAPCEPSITLGKLIDRGSNTDRKIHLDTRQLQKHCFVTGCTGSGKSNTMRHLLTELWREHKIPFLVIEPVKREYRLLRESLGDDLQVFTLGADKDGLSLNPFDFEPAVGLVPHIDNLKAAFNAALGTYSSMPFILEDIIYQVYTQRGWDIDTGGNSLLEKTQDVLDDSGDGLRDLFLPCLEDMLPLVQQSIANFFPATTDYSGSLTGALRARLSSMTKGSKGALLNRRCSMPLDTLLEKPCVLELWRIPDNDEKAFVMALVLLKLYEYHQRQDMAPNAPRNNDLKHLLVIEEAHRLLAKPNPSGEHSVHGRQKGVEVFADMLAEIRSYGQGIVIVDQIPSKLIPDVLRNTDVKIAHRLVDKEDRQTLGATMNLDEEQLQDLGRASPGQASIFFGGLSKALLVAVPESPLRGTPVLAPAHDILSSRRQGAFGAVATETFPALNKDIGLVFALGASTLALCCGAYDLVDLRPQFVNRISNHIGSHPADAVWNLLAEGFYRLPEKLANQGIRPDLACYLACVSAKTVKGWLASEDITGSLARLKGENVGLGLIEALTSRRISDFTDILLKIRIDVIRGSFQSQLGGALEKAALENNAALLLPTLTEHAQAALLGFDVAPKVINDVALRILLRFETDSPKLQETVGRCYAVLDQWMRGSLS